MYPKIAALFVLIGLLIPLKTAWGQEDSIPGAVIDGPQGGEALQGQVQISGSADPEDFFAYEISFSYTGDSTGTWFLIEESVNPVSEGVLAEWDTFVITDGSYNLRLVVTLKDGSTLVTIQEGLRIRNYSPVETSTPTPVPSATATPTVDLTAAFIEATRTPIPTETGTPPPPATLTPLPTNPAQVDGGEITYSLARGAAGVLAAFILLGMYTSIRNARRS